MEQDLASDRPGAMEGKATLVRAILECEEQARTMAYAWRKEMGGVLVRPATKGSWPLPAAEREAGGSPALRLAADPIEPVRDYNIPIPEHRLPPNKDNFPRNRPRRDKPATPRREKETPPPRQDGHVDEYV